MLQVHESPGVKRSTNERGGVVEESAPVEGASIFYLEIMELDWDWVEEVVAALS